MASSHTTLASLWDDGQGSPLKVLQQQGTPGTKVTLATAAGAEIKEDVLKFYKDKGLDSFAKEAGILDSNGELVTLKDQSGQGKNEQIIMIPISSPAKSPYRTQVISQQQLMSASPQAVLSSASPVVLSGTNTQQQVMAAQVLTQKSGQIITTPIKVEPWNAAQVRKRQPEYFDDYSESKRKKGDKGGKGLRHFSMKVCEKVKAKGVTSYNEVADELVMEFSENRHLSPNDSAYDQKNIRRRVYDALNVLMAMDIITKEKKEIRWIGLPTNSAQECQNFELEHERRKERIRHKTHQLQELILQQIAFKNLVQRNRRLEQVQGPPSANSAIQLPFIIVNTSKKTVIDCSISNDKFEYLFNFDNTFEIHDDIEVLKRMGMAFGLEKGLCNADDLRKSTKMVPKALEPYVYEMAHVQPPESTAIIGGHGPVTGGPGSTSRPTSATTFDHSLDAEVALATSRALSRQSSVTSYSDMPSAQDSPEEYSDSESGRSSPVDFQ